MPHALFLSPHLDDVAFSCAGTAMRFAREGWHVTVLTVFTRSAVEPTGFALKCQLDKGIRAEADYMAIRRAEDREFCRRAGLPEPVHLNLPEAPHRGYESAEALFGKIHSDDEIWRQIAIPNADLHFVPQGLGGHVDHLQVLRALTMPAIRYQDAPYALRANACSPVVVKTTTVLEQKLNAIEAYTSQLPFQFGGATAMRAQLTTWEERFATDAEALLTRWTGFHQSLPEDTQATS